MSDTSDKPWCDMSRREKLALMSEGLGDSEHQAQVMAAVEEHFRYRSMKDPLAVINVVSRESWRASHGEVESWDRSAREMRASGLMNDPSLLPDGIDL
jgi:hypothetical protein